MIYVYSICQWPPDQIFFFLEIKQKQLPVIYFSLFNRKIVQREKHPVSVLLAFRHAEFKTNLHLRFPQNTRLFLRQWETWKIGNTFSVFLVSIAPLYTKKIWVTDSIYKQDHSFYLNDVFWYLLLGIFSLYFRKPLCYIITISNRY